MNAIPTKQIFDQQQAASLVTQARDLAGIRANVLANKLGISAQSLAHREKSGVGLNAATYREHMAAIEALTKTK